MISRNFYTTENPKNLGICLFLSDFTEKFLLPFLHFQVANLSTRVDIAETEMRVLRTQESWVGSDVIEIQRLNEELSEQKAELHEKIAKQDDEIEKLTHEIAELKNELDRLQRFLSDENSKGQRNFDHGRSRQDR